MFDFIISCWDSILVILSIIALVIFLFRAGFKKQANEILFYLVTKAEKKYGGGTGELKYATVVTWLYERLPAIFRWLFTKKQIGKLIEQAVIRMKEYLSKDNKAKEITLEKNIE